MKYVIYSCFFSLLLITQSCEVSTPKSKNNDIPSIDIDIEKENKASSIFNVSSLKMSNVTINQEKINQEDIIINSSESVPIN